MVLNPFWVEMAEQLSVQFKITKDQYYYALFHVAYIETDPTSNVIAGAIRKLQLLALDTEKGLVEPLLVPDVFSGEINVNNVEKFVESNIDSYRAVWSIGGAGKIGLKTGAMGDRAACIKKMIKWFENNNYIYSWDQVIRASRAYVQSISELRYLQQADYFISKDSTSRLSAMVEEVPNTSAIGPFKQLI